MMVRMKFEVVGGMVVSVMAIPEEKPQMAQISQIKKVYPQIGQISQNISFNLPNLRIIFLRSMCSVVSLFNL